MDAGSAYRSDVYEYTGADLRPDSSLFVLLASFTLSEEEGEKHHGHGRVLLCSVTK